MNKALSAKNGPSAAQMNKSNCLKQIFDCPAPGLKPPLL